MKNQLKKLAKDFNLKYDSKWFKHLWVHIRYEILIEYIEECPDPIYQKYGESSLERIKNIDNFVNSKDFKDCLKNHGGQVFQKEGLKNIRLFKKINNKSLQKELTHFYNKIKKKIGKSNSLALVTIPRNKKEKKWLEKYCLREEWIHILMAKNNLHFQSISKRYWVYDEGIATYLAYFLDKRLNQLEKEKKKQKNYFEKKYFIYAIKFKELLKNINNPKKRKEKIINLKKSLKK